MCTLSPTSRCDSATVECEGVAPAAAAAGKTGMDAPVCAPAAGCCEDEVVGSAAGSRACALPSPLFPSSYPALPSAMSPRRREERAGEKALQRLRMDDKILVRLDGVRDKAGEGSALPPSTSSSGSAFLPPSSSSPIPAPVPAATIRDDDGGEEGEELEVC